MTDEEKVLKYNEIRNMEAKKKRKTTAQRCKQYRIRKKLGSEEVKEFIQLCPNTSAMTDEEKLLKYTEMKAEKKKQQNAENEKQVNAKRCKEYRLRKTLASASKRPLFLVPIQESKEPAAKRFEIKRNITALANVEFSKRVYKNSFGFACSVCNRLRFQRNLRFLPNNYCLSNTHLSK